MTAGPACERCRSNSYEGSQIGYLPVICPFCHKPKQRGSREEIVKVLYNSKHALIAAVGYLTGASIQTKQGIINWLKDVIKEIDDV